MVLRVSIPLTQKIRNYYRNFFRVAYYYKNGGKNHATENDNHAARTGEEIGAKVPQLRYLIQTGRIPSGERLGRSLTYTPDQAEQIRDWWQVRQKLVFKEGK